MDENNQSLFEEKLNELVKLGHKKKNVVDNNDIQDVFADIELSEENHERIYETLEQNNIDILTITEDDNLLPDDDIILLDGEGDDEDIILGEDEEVDELLDKYYREKRRNKMPRMDCETYTRVESVDKEECKMGRPI